MTEFLINEHWAEVDTVVVTGMVNTGSVRVGTVFTGVSRAPSPQIASESTAVVYFRVIRIVAYGHAIYDLPDGMSGELFMKGEQTGHLKHGYLLVSK